MNPALTSLKRIKPLSRLWSTWMRTGKDPENHRNFQRPSCSTSSSTSPRPLSRMMRRSSTPFMFLKVSTFLGTRTGASQHAAGAAEPPTRERPAGTTHAGSVRTLKTWSGGRGTFALTMMEQNSPFFCVTMTSCVSSTCTSCDRGRDLITHSAQGTQWA